MLKLPFKPSYMLLAALLVFMGVVPWFIPSYPLHLLVVILMYVYLAQAYNISAGFAGSFGFLHPIFIGTGAYTSTLLFNNLGVSPWLGMLAGALLAVVVSIPITFMSIRAKLPRLSFALITMAFVFIAMYAADSFAVLGGGDRGVQIPYKPSLLNFQFSSKIGYYYVMLGLTIGIMLACWQILRSRLGLYFRAMADNEKASQAVGVNLMKYNLVAMGISAFFTALGGSFYAQFVGSLLPSTVISMTLMISVILFLAVGGFGTFWGPVVGVVLLMPIGETLRSRLPQFQSLHLFLYGIIVIVILIFLPHGIMGTIESIRDKRRAKTAKKVGEAKSQS